ncbi:MFS transporter [Sanguibacter inulinus]|uniref:MFS transporter n=1 Tax=Sanguibacter inulinus TaxID=60922 RepID=A0A853EX80_9MICO|nr:MFS transporter [Sanguibacter inulinus]MBF0722323.1 MFS transporter [Sanguibacter inulinus]NYS93468.1 MFS transporter [Sanguibacter inulinus]
METSRAAEPRIPGQVWFRTSVAGMASYLDAAAIISTGTALVLYQEPLGLTVGDIGRLSALLTFMIAVGALVGGRLGDLYGRKRVFMVTMALYTVGAALMVVAGGPALLYVGVVLLGIAVGADLPVSLAMIAEEAPEGARGRLVSFSHILWLVGILAAQLLGIIVGNMGQTGGRALYVHLTVVAIVTMVLRARLPESHLWAAAHQGDPALAPAATGGGPGQAAPGDSVDLGTLKQLLRGPFLAPMLAVALFYALVNIGANTGGQFNTYMYVNLAGSTVQLASTVSFITFGIAFGATYLLMRIVDGSNRMRWFTVMAVFYTAGYLVPAILGVHLWTLVTMGVVGSIAGAIAGEPMFKIWAQELFPTVYRSTAQGVMIAITRVVAAVVALWTPTLLDSSPSLLFFFVAACIACGALIGIFWINRYPRVADDEVEEVSAAPAAR